MRMLSYPGEGLQESLYQRVLSHVWKVKAASIVLEEAFDRHAPTPDLNGETVSLAM